MAKDRRPAEDLSIAELEAILARKRLEARQARIQRFRRTGRVLSVPDAPNGSVDLDEGGDLRHAAEESIEKPQSTLNRVLNRSLLIVEVAAVLGFLYILLSGAGALQKLNAEVAQALSGQASPTPLITAVVLPSGHTPPNSPQGARFNEAEIPENLRPFVQTYSNIPLPTPGPEQARSILIPAILNGEVPVVQGDGWEQLKKGVGQHMGSADPGKNGNLVLSAHNDIYGEWFRDLDQLSPGDEIVIKTATQVFTYRVTRTRIVSPTDVSVLEPTSKATITLVSCYPYLVDNQRIVVFGELADR
ncbi:MAG: class E sortase [Anaerolineales bacterium]|jgi:sortase A